MKNRRGYLYESYQSRTVKQAGGSRDQWGSQVVAGRSRGYIEVVYPFEELVALICDEEGKLNTKPLNRALRDDDGDIVDIIAGTFLIAGLDDEDFCSLTDSQIEKFTKMFEKPEVFVKRADGRIREYTLKDGEQ